ncbi:MAG: hypothetical protein AAF206_15485 [Bacteroidota bacterium]
MNDIRHHIHSAAAYLYNLPGAVDPTVIEKGQFIRSDFYHQQAKLNPEQTKRVLDMVSVKLPRAKTHGARCFLPRHLIVFKDAEGQIIGQVRVCFECNLYRCTPQPSYDENSLDYFRELFAELGIDVFDHPLRYIALMGPE